MDSLLNLPEVQSAAAPLLVALLVAALCGWKRPELTGVAALAGFMTTVLLVNGTTLTPLTATRKIILIAGLAGLAGVALDLLRWKAPARPWLFGLLGAGTAIWVTINYLQRQQGLDLWLPALGLAAYSAWIPVMLERLQTDSLRLGSTAVALAIGTGGAATLGASALLGQLAFGAAAASGACLLLAVVSRKAMLGSTLTLAIGPTLALIGGAAVLFASLPWYCLLLLAASPALPMLVRFEHENRFIHAGAHGVLALLPGLVAIYLSWNAAPQSLY